MDRIDIYNNITDSFSKKFSWLGKQFSNEFLMSACSYNLQTMSKPEYRVRRHLLLFWGFGYYKSTLLIKAYQLLSDQLATNTTDISNAALRGTVESGQFVTPLTLKRPFTVCTEFGQITAGSDGELQQKLLNILEEGYIQVSLGKIAFLTNEQKEKAKSEHGISFLDNNTFSYKTDWILMAGTYNKKFMLDNAFESRFVIMQPEQKLDGALIRHVVKAKPFYVDEETKSAFRHELFSPLAIDCNIELPEEIYELPKVTPRVCSNLLSYILCRSWWNLETKDKEVIDMAKQYCKNTEELWQSADDKVFTSLEFGSKSAKEIAEETGLTLRQVYYSLKNIRAVRLMGGSSDSKWRL